MEGGKKGQESGRGLSPLSSVETQGFQRSGHLALGLTSFSLIKSSFPKGSYEILVRCDALRPGLKFGPCRLLIVGPWVGYPTFLHVSILVLCLVPPLLGMLALVVLVEGAP